MKTTLLVMGTRPEIIKMAPIAWALRARNMPYEVFFTAQHWDRNMGKEVFIDMGYDPNVIVGRELYRISESRRIWLPDLASADLQARFSMGDIGIVLAEGDTHTVGRTALVCVQQSVPFAHIEAGLRSFDFKMREERYRCMADAVADYLFLPLIAHQKNVEGCSGVKFVVGNTIVDALRYSMKDKKPLARSHALITLHRWELLQDSTLFEATLQMISRELCELQIEAIFPIHPHTRKLFEVEGTFRNIKVVDPLSTRDFLHALADSFFVLTDSGGVQEEACILGVPCGILRDKTERPETIDVGAAVLIPLSALKLANLKGLVALQPESWQQPYGENVGEKIVDLLEIILRRTT